MLLPAPVPSADRVPHPTTSQYGYDSILGYNPKLDLAIAVASNIETPEQLQPSDAFCRVFNRAKNFLNGESVQTCTFEASGYYGGKCSCT